jgi:predicted Zn-dependent protease
VYQRVAAAYSQNEEQKEKAEKIYKIMARRFCKEPEVWTQLGQFYFKTGNLKDARSAEPRFPQSQQKQAYGLFKQKFHSTTYIKHSR